MLDTQCYRVRYANIIGPHHAFVIEHEIFLLQSMLVYAIHDGRHMPRRPPLWEHGNELRPDLEIVECGHDRLGDGFRHVPGLGDGGTVQRAICAVYGANEEGIHLRNVTS